MSAPQLKVALLAKRIYVQGHIRKGLDGQLWGFIDGRFQHARTRIAQQVLEYLGDNWRMNHLREVLAWCESRDQILGHSDTDWLNFKNGMYNYLTGERADHAPKFNSIVQIPHAYNPEATCSQIFRFLHASLEPDALELFFEMVGLTLLETNPEQKVFLFLGKGGNGKSSALKVMTALLGKSNVSGVPLQTMTDNRFASVLTVGKLANFSGEVSKNSMKKPELLRAYTGGDPIYVEHKGSPGFMAEPTATLIFAANTMPRSMLQTLADRQRWIILTFPNSFRGRDTENKNLITELTTPDELEGFLVQAVAGVQRMFARGGIAIPESVRRAGNEQQELDDSVMGFIADQCTLVAGAWTRRKVLFQSFELWCHGEGRFPLSAPAFYARLQDNNPNLSITQNRNGIRGFSGIELRSRPEEDRKTLHRGLTAQDRMRKRNHD